jgi:hypothetical protein
VHSYTFSPADTIQDLTFGKAWQWSLAYGLLAGLLLLGRQFKRQENTGH